MIPIFIPCPRWPGSAPRARSRRSGRGLVERLRSTAKRVVADGGPDPGDARQLASRPSSARQIDRERVQDDAVAPADARGREAALSMRPGACAARRRGRAGSRRSWGCAGRAACRAPPCVSTRLWDVACASGGASSVTTTSVSRACPRRQARASASAASAAEKSKTPFQDGRKWYGGGYTCTPRGCGGIGRRARFRSVWAKARGGSSPLIRITRLRLRECPNRAQTTSGRKWRGAGRCPDAAIRKRMGACR